VGGGQERVRIGVEASLFWPPMSARSTEIIEGGWGGGGGGSEYRKGKAGLTGRIAGR